MNLHGNRIEIRPLISEYKSDYCLVLSDPRVSGTLRGEVPGSKGQRLLSDCTLAELKLKFDVTLQRKIDGKYCVFAVLLISTGKFVGSIGSYAIDEKRIGLTYWLSAENHGNGLGTEMLSMYCDPALKYFQKASIIANVANDNLASAVAVQKAGFKLTDHDSDTGFDITTGRKLFEWS